ncbi:hypothetical protein JG688_00017209 [Phytophthora aleatoria]|uniref:Uncharacterized protein n=1 Tax=Phytophthora aleatoria TaxID=2496075 RepID=A0A8J5IXE4_9STRA|nr:hypothetical protein JG688_00017209 [Phytophthora aleatoria]
MSDTKKTKGKRTLRAHTTGGECGSDGNTVQDEAAVKESRAKLNALLFIDEEGVFRVGVKWHDSTHNHLIDKNVFNTYAETRKSASLRLVALVGHYGKV